MASQDEIEERLETLKGYKTDGYSYTVLVQLAMKTWDISESQAKRDLKELKNREKELGSTATTELLGSNLNQFDRLYTKAIQANDLDLARKILADKTQLIALIQKQPQRGQSNDTTQHQSQLPADELATIMELFRADGETPRPVVTG